VTYQVVAEPQQEEEEEEEDNNKGRETQISVASGPQPSGQP